jgi:hypothetical protein
MYVKEEKRTKTIEEIISTRWIAEDGEEFYDEQACKDYEESAEFVLSSKLKRLAVTDADRVTGYGSDEIVMEVYDIPTDKDLEILKRYLMLKTQRRIYGKLTEEVIEKHRWNICKRLENLTSGHEVVIEYSYDEDMVYSYGDGSINAFLESIRNSFAKEIKKYEEKKA